MNTFNQKIIDTLKKQNFMFSDDIFDKFCVYANLLIEWNKKVNLTAIVDPEEIAIKHFGDCLNILLYVNIPKGARVIDIGTGAGFPGVPLKIVRPDIEITLMDSLNKRLFFLDDVLKNLSIKANLVHARAEDFARKENYRHQFDFVLSRAVAKLNVLSELCLPYVKIGGLFIAMKSKDAELEVEGALNSIKLLGGNLEKIDNFNLINENQRSIVQIKKFKETPSIYPRSTAKISKKPL